MMYSIKEIKKCKVLYAEFLLLLLSNKFELNVNQIKVFFSPGKKDLMQRSMGRGDEQSLFCFRDTELCTKVISFYFNLMFKMENISYCKILSC